MQMTQRRGRFGALSAGAGLSLLLLSFGTIQADGGDGAPIVPQPRVGEPLLDLTPSELSRFLNGRAAYDMNLSPEDGLGPVFNNTSCGTCHTSPLGGHGSQSVTRFGFSDKGSFDPLDEFGGSLLQANAINLDCEEVIPVEANVTTLRTTPGMLGYGLVESILDADLYAQESSPPGISGRAHRVEAFEAPGVERAGRFGWKAQVPTMLTFSADAALNEMGLTNRFITTENDPNGIRPPHLGDCDDVADPEDGVHLGGGIEFIDAVTDFQRFLAQPPQTPRSGMSGEAIFNSIGCADCHTQSYTTSNDGGLEDALRNKAIQPYSDFLLHDMGLAGDFIPTGDATGTEIRTTPLWGVRWHDPMWHDGRFSAGTFEDRVTDAIMEHGAFGSEGIPAATNYSNLSSEDKSAVLAFLDSLGRREFDGNGDDTVDLSDFLEMVQCAAGGPYTPDDPCSIYDIDQDGDVDINDYDSFLLVYSGPDEDCNKNGTTDITDIFVGASADSNANGIPDECESICAADIANDDGEVNTQDLLALLANWGTDGPGATIAAPLDVVNTSDLLGMLATWGPCK